MSSILRIITAMVIWGSIGLFVKNIDLPSIEIAFLRAFIATIILIAGRFYIKNKSENKINNKYDRKNIFYLVISGVMLALNWLFLFQAFKFTTVANATLSYYSAPIFVVLLSPIVLKEKITIRKLSSVIIAMTGLVLIVSKQSQVGNVNYMHIKGIGYGIIAAMFYASVILFNKTIKGLSSYDRTLVQIFISTVVLLPFVLYRNNIHITSFNMLFIIIIIGTIHTGLAYLLYFSSIEHVSAQRVSILSYIDPISAVIFGTIFLNEPLSMFHIVGGALILISTFIGK